MFLPSSRLSLHVWEERAKAANEPGVKIAIPSGSLSVAGLVGLMS